MKKNKTIVAIIMLASLAAVAVALWASPAGTQLNNDCSCQESLDEPAARGQEAMGWENLSHQFFSSF